MAAERVLTRSLSCFLVLVAALLLRGLDSRWSEPAYDEAVRQLADGDLEGRERVGLLRLLADRGPAVPDLGREPLLAAAMAAVLLGDRARYEACRERLVPGGSLPVSPADGGVLAAAALGEPTLAALLAGMAAESGGLRDTAASAYRRVAALAVAWNLPLAGELAAAGLARVQ